MTGLAESAALANITRPVTDKTMSGNIPEKAIDGYGGKDF